MEASKIQAQQLKDCFDRIEWECGVSGILDEVVSFCKKREAFYFRNKHPVLGIDFREKAEMITELANKIRNREWG